MSDHFKNYTINETQFLVNSSYDNFVLVKNEYDDIHLETISDVIRGTFKFDIKYSEYRYIKQEFWFEKFECVKFLAF